MSLAAPHPTSAPDACGASITNHVLTIPHAQFPTFLTQIVLLRTATASSLFVHCTNISPLHAQTLVHRNTSSSATDAEASSVMGVLAADFSLAMAAKPEPLATSISSTLAAASAGTSTAWSKRLARRLNLPQLLLSLDLPAPLLPSPGRVQAPQDSHALLALERALRDACSQVLSTHPHAQ